MNAITKKKLITLESAYNWIIYRDPMERLALTRWLWRRLSGMYDRLETDF